MDEVIAEGREVQHDPQPGAASSGQQLVDPLPVGLDERRVRIEPSSSNMLTMRMEFSPPWVARATVVAGVFGAPGLDVP